MPSQRYLIVNADDFGLSQGVNRGIVRAHREGIVTSTSLMVRWPAAGEAALYSAENPRLSFGLHVELAEWVYRNYEWVPKYEVVRADDERAVNCEVERQVERFRQIMGRDPTHIDSHQHTHRNEPALSVISRIAEQLAVPLRSFSPQVQYCGNFYGQTGEGDPYPEGISLEGLITTIRTLSEGVTEMGCHPGDDPDLDSVYRAERIQELRVLCHPDVRATLACNNVVLCSFTQLKALGSLAAPP